MRRSLGLLIAALLLGSVLAVQPAPASAEPAKAPAAATVVQSQLIWTSGTLIANAYGTQVYEMTVRWPFRQFGEGSVVAHPGLRVRWHARALDKKVISGGFWSCASIDVDGPSAWYEFAPCNAYFTAANQPYRLIDAYFHYQYGTLQDLNIVDLKVDYLGNAAGLWVWDL